MASLPGFGQQQAPPPPAGPRTLRSPHLAVDQFLPAATAEALRQGIEDHFDEPHAQRPDVHQVWNYWYVPDLYTYLRTGPDKIVAPALVREFETELTRWAKSNLGMGHITRPNLSLYVDGCRQGLHNDSSNGRFGYVYSLTKAERKTIGGETIVLREGDLFRDNMTNATAGWGLYDLIEPSFNRLVIFDDRMPHGVQLVEGSMDPLEGRFVLHGHISEKGPVVGGTLDQDAVAAIIDAGLAEAVANLADGPTPCHGPLVLRFFIIPTGEVRSVFPIVDRLARQDGGPTADAVERLVTLASALRFPAGATPTEVNAPLMVGGPLPWMKPPPLVRPF